MRPSDEQTVRLELCKTAQGNSHRCVQHPCQCAKVNAFYIRDVTSNKWFGGNFQPPKDVWATTLDEGNKYDEGLIKKWKEEMDNLLLFVNIFASYAAIPSHCV